jgi:hypothetical protein
MNKSTKVLIFALVLGFALGNTDSPPPNPDICAGNFNQKKICTCNSESQSDCNYAERF